MTPEYFPADVSVRVEGDLVEARQYVGAAKNLLFKALQAKKTGGVSHTTLTRAIPGTDATVTVVLAGSLKIVYISTGKGPVDTVTTKKLPGPPPPGEFLPLLMVSGTVHEGGLVTRAIDSVVTCSEFHPTFDCAQSHKIVHDYYNSPKLAVALNTVHSDLSTPLFAGAEPAQSAHLKASMYSGTMKRVVQALQGLGHIKYRPPTGALVNQDVQVLYDYKWIRTHGIVTAGPRNHWLVEISQARGVLAMPLPLLAGTTTADYRMRTRALGDTGAYAVLREFGGMPSGETFPTGAALTAAIVNGTVLELLTAADLDPFYTVWGAYGPTLGWAFSESGIEAHTTGTRVGTASMYNFEAPAALHTWTGHYALRIELSLHDRTPPPSTPVGTGTAVLREVAAVPIYVPSTPVPWGSYYPISVAPFYLPLAGLEPLLQRDLGTFTGVSVDQPHEAVFDRTPRLAPVYVFFRGEELEQVYAINQIGTKKMFVSTTMDYSGSQFWGTSDPTFLPGYGVGIIAPRGTREAAVVMYTHGAWMLANTTAQGFGVTRLDDYWREDPAFHTSALDPPVPTRPDYPVNWEGHPPYLYASNIYMPIREPNIEHFFDLVVNANGERAYVHHNTTYHEFSEALPGVTQVGPQPFPDLASTNYSFVGKL